SARGSSWPQISWPGCRSSVSMPGAVVPRSWLTRCSVVSAFDKHCDDMTADPILDERFVVPDHVVHRSFAAETVVLNLETGGYHGLNEVGGFMLGVLAATGDPGEVVQRVVTEYGAPLDRARTDVASFCTDLLERRLIERAKRLPGR